MNPSIRYLSETAGKETKRIIGLMSGTSLDGLDLALCNISGHGGSTRLEVSHFETVEYPPDVTGRLREVVFRDTLSSEDLCIINSWLGEYHAEVVLEQLRNWEVEPDRVDCIASHGQTVWHAPGSVHRKEGLLNATLQIGDGDHIARKTGILTVSDFRQKHTAAGGEGAPMVALADRLLFGDEQENRIMLNIGGIANFTFLPVEGKMIAADTGPGNTLINAAMDRLYDKPFDRKGAVAAKGTPSADLLKEMLSVPYLRESFPKTTGPELFSWEWLEDCRDKAGIGEIKPEDLVATLTWFSAQTISESIQKVVPDEMEQDHNYAVYVSGGGLHNETLIKWIKRLLEHEKIFSFDKIGFLPDAKEAAAFAVLANETLSGKGFLISPKGGPEWRVNFGKISLPV